MNELNQSQIDPATKETCARELIGVHQIAVYVICGGGHLGRLAAENPAAFRMEDTVRRLPYSRDEVRRSVATLARIAQAHGFNPHDLPCMPLLHSFGIL
jgi:hypothetical protein